MQGEAAETANLDALACRERLTYLLQDDAHGVVDVFSAEGVLANSKQGDQLRLDHRSIPRRFCWSASLLPGWDSTTAWCRHHVPTAPYVLTAGHCAPDAASAASIEAVWFHRERSCVSAEGTPVQSVHGEAELLYPDPLTDISLLRLRRAPPPGAVFAEWSLRLPEPGGAVASAHHPWGLRQAIAFGSVTSMVPCAEVPLCEGGGADDAGHYLRVRWEQGRTDVGSSGSGLFLPSGELVGVLSGGFGDCADTPGLDHYGRFDLTYRAGLSRWLGRPMTQ